MSWFGYKTRKEAEEARETKRQQLEADRLARSLQRAERQKSLQAAVQARQEADKALQDLLEIDPEIFEKDSDSNASEVPSDFLEDTDDMANDIVDFEDEDGVDDARALGVHQSLGETTM